MEHYTRIENKFLEKLSSAELSGSDFRVVLVVFRKTNGFLKENDWISYTQFERFTGLTRKSIAKTLARLIKANILLVTKGKLLSYKLNIDVDSWVVTKRKLVTNCTPTSYQMVTQVVTKRKHTKETITKENIQKKIVSKDTNSVVQKRNVELIVYFKQRLGTELDGTNEENWRYCTHTWNKLRRMYPDKNTDEGVRLLIDASLSDDFHSQNATNFKYIFRNISKIVKSVAEQNKKKKSKIAFI